MMSLRLHDWLNENEPGEQMLWKGAAENQCQEFLKIARELQPGLEPLVVETHTSKSIKLPVVVIDGKYGKFYLRDNFHDVNLCVLWDFPPDLQLADVYRELDWDWYTEKMKKCEDYSWSGWSQEELDDPRITRVQAPTVDGKNTYWNDRRPEQKDRWAKRMEDPEWYYTDWSSGKLLVAGGLSNMGPGCKMYAAMNAFMEGLSRVEAIDYDARELFEPGMSKFTMAVGSLDDALELMKKINGAGAYSG